MFVFGVGLSGASVPLLAVTVIGLGVCVAGGRGFNNVFAAVALSDRDPLDRRRVGDRRRALRRDLGPVLGGFLLAAQFSPRNLFFTIAAPSLVSALAMAVLDMRLRRRESFAKADAAA